MECSKFVKNKNNNNSNNNKLPKKANTCFGNFSCAQQEEQKTQMKTVQNRSNKLFPFKKLV